MLCCWWLSFISSFGARPWNIFCRPKWDSSKYSVSKSWRSIHRDWYMNFWCIVWFKGIQWCQWSSPCFTSLWYGMLYIATQCFIAKTWPFSPLCSPKQGLSSDSRYIYPLWRWHANIFLGYTQCTASAVAWEWKQNEIVKLVL